MTSTYRDQEDEKLDLGKIFSRKYEVKFPKALDVISKQKVASSRLSVSEDDRKAARDG